MNTDGMKVLWIDDEIYDDEVQKISYRINGLTRAGLVVTAETDPSNALDLLKGETFNVILLDIMMAPGHALANENISDGYSTGIAFLHKLRLQGCTTPVVLFTIKAVSMDKETMDRLNVRAILPKPMDAEKLAEAIRAALK